jgi:hypothetical protein
LVERDVTEEGIRYRAGENAAPYLTALSSEYLRELKQRAQWLVAEHGDRSEQEFRAIMRRFFDQWVEEFQAAERSFGSDA